MTRIFFFIAVLSCSILQAQKTDSEIVDIDSFQIKDKTIDLKDYGNALSEFKLVTRNEKRVIFEFEEPSKLKGQGRCASGTEKGFLVLSLNDKTGVLDSDRYLYESCLLSIELETKENPDSGTIQYLCSNYQTSDLYVLKLNLEEVQITKTSRKE